MAGKETLGPGARRDLSRNSAFFLGAFGTTLGLLGSTLAGLGIVASLVPGAAQNAPDWVFAVVVILLLVAIVGAWPALDWLANRYPRGGAVFMGGVATAMMAIGGVAVWGTEWDLPGWCALTGGLTLLVGARLAAIGGGTTPLEWASLRTERVRAVESRVDVVASRVIAVVNLYQSLWTVPYFQRSPRSWGHIASEPKHPPGGGAAQYAAWPAGLGIRYLAPFSFAWRR